jgi:hypothetical protein
MELFITTGNGIWILASVSFEKGTVFIRGIQYAGSYCKIMADVLGKPYIFISVGHDLLPEIFNSELYDLR